MAKSFYDLVNRTTTKKTQTKAVRRAQELLGELLLSEARLLSGAAASERTPRGPRMGDGGKKGRTV
jgi:hypothetical protein